MRDFRHAKAMARTLRAALAAREINITVSQSLELIAEAFGLADWNTLAAMIRADASELGAKSSSGAADTEHALRRNRQAARAAPPQFSTALSAGLQSTLLRAIASAGRRRHQYATLEHLLLALIDDRDAAAAMAACAVDLDRLKAQLLNYIDDELKTLVVDDEEPRLTAAFQRVVQRAAITQSSALEKATGANVLVAILAERESYAVYSLMEQGVARHDLIHHINGSAGSGDGDSAA